jgi:asparagine synthase (glutamine-hydrolysing)
MCGIFAVINNTGLETPAASAAEPRGDVIPESRLREAFARGAGRGPEHSVFTQLSPLVTLGFHRLAINGLNSGANQPLTCGNLTLICNGEIYNYKALKKIHGLKTSTDSDCEVILHLYREFGMDKTLQLLNGVFAFVLIETIGGLDNVSPQLTRVWCARDNYGVRPMFHLAKRNGTHLFASELKQVCDFYTPGDTLGQFAPGTAAMLLYRLGSASAAEVELVEQRTLLHRTMELPWRSEAASLGIEDHLRNINKALRAAVARRVANTDRQIACLLSGGLDSSLITALVASCVPDPSTLETYSIGLAGGEDLRYARQVAEFLGTNHTEIVVTEAEFFDAIGTVIGAIESYDTTTVRASVGNYLIGKYISEHSDAKVIFNGDGSDEVAGGYMYFHYAPDDAAFDQECRRLLKSIHYFDVLRSDRCISCHGLEPRTPFLDKMFVANYLNVPVALRNHTNEKRCEKYLLRKAFADDNLLPDQVLWRTKEAFSDGVSSQKKSWHTIIKSRIKGLMGVDDPQQIVEQKQDAGSGSGSGGLTLEKKYYQTMFRNLFGNIDFVIPYYWMPAFTTETGDCSARELKVYTQNANAQ